MDQNLINFTMAGLGAAIGFILKVIWDGLRELQLSDLQITARINELQLLVAGQYVKREDLEKLTNALFAKLDKIEAKLDGKMDKQV